MDVAAQSVFEQAERVVAAEFEGAVDAHPRGLGGGVLFGAIRLAVFAQADTVADQAAQRTRESPPLTGGVVLVDFLRFAQQMHEAVLSIGHVDRFVRAPEVVQQNAVEGVAALVGVAPINRDSGTMRGKRTTWGGRKVVRSALYMAALVACMRKLLVMLNAIIRTKTP